MSDNFDIDSILDSELDDLQDLPAFEVFPAGAHRVTVSLDLKKIGDKQMVEALFVYKEPVELADAEATPPKAGDKCSTLFDLGNEFGQGAFKKFAAPIGAAQGLTKNREILEQTKNFEVVIISKVRVQKGKDGAEDKKYLQVNEVIVE